MRVSAQEIRNRLASLEEIIDPSRRPRGSREAHEALCKLLRGQFQSLLADLPVDDHRVLDEGRWNALNDSEADGLLGRLQMIETAARELIHTDGPAEKRSIMHRDYASNRWVWTLGALGGVLVIALVIAICVRWGSAVGDPNRPPIETEIVLMIVLMGALGGLVHMTTSFVKYVGNRQLMKSWIPYYLLSPVKASALALIFFLVLRAGIIIPRGSDGEQVSKVGLIGYYAFAAMTGLFSPQATEMLSDVFSAVFSRVRGKDKIENEKAPGK